MIDAFLRNAQAVFQHERDKLAAAQREQSELHCPFFLQSRHLHGRLDGRHVDKDIVFHTAEAGRC